MPKFVPVSDPEAPKFEQDYFSRENLKHRKFDKGTTDRGWQQGSVGWGVVNRNFGSDEKDMQAQVFRKADGHNKMVKNEKGLWVKAKDLSSAPSMSSSLSLPPTQVSDISRGRGRGGSLSVPGSSLGDSIASEFSRDKGIIRDGKAVIDYGDERFRDARQESGSSKAGGDSYHSRSDGRDRDGRNRSRDRRYGSRSRSRERDSRKGQREDDERSRYEDRDREDYKRNDRRRDYHDKEHNKRR